MEAFITPGLVISLIIVAVGIFVIAKGLVIIGDDVDSAENPCKSLEFQILPD